MPSVRQVILETLSQRGPLGIAEIAQATKLSKMAARYHVALLERDGLVTGHGVEHRGSVGRPKVQYVLAERAHDLLPKRYEAFAAQLLDEVTRTLGPKSSREFLRRAGRRAAAAAPKLSSDAGRAVHLNRLVRFLSPRGYRVSWSTVGDHYELVMHDCPYRLVARARPLVCEMDKALVGALLGERVTMTTCIAAQDADCHFVIEN